MPKRDQPLEAHPRPGPAPTPAPVETQEAESRLAAGVRRIRIVGRRLGPRMLMILGGIFVPVGLLMVWFGWYGAAHRANVFEQIPYMISGGLFGVALVFLGGFCYFAHWLTQIVKESREQSVALLEALTRLEETVRREAGNDRVALANVVGNGAAKSGSGRASRVVPEKERVVLVATGKGTMAHRPECVVVAGKPGLREVEPEDGLAACKLCDPYNTDAEAHSLN